MADDRATTYQQLLDEAWELGRLDGRFAAAFERAGATPSGRCLGRTPQAFARLLWEGRPGNPPSGLEANAPLWYATGFREGLAAGPASTRRGVRGLSHRRVLV
ncbi:hypothetical protein [Blastococcus litoris]|uniref:hypothetical protein n=1 Tax=Blastococcus litoris TaxID=2171622 RepID=UPI000E300F3F|nr:hypothetical protein [Blastococcus litoris]